MSQPIELLDNPDFIAALQDPSLSGGKIAKRFGCAKTTVNKWRSRIIDQDGRPIGLKLADVKENAKLSGDIEGYRFEQKVDGSIDASTTPSEAPQTVQQAEQVLRDKGIDPERYNVSYGFSEWDAQRKIDGEAQTVRLNAYRIRATPKLVSARDMSSYDDLKESLAGWRATLGLGYSATNLTGTTSVLNASDLQIGKAMQRGGGTKETVARARESIRKFAEYVVQTRPDEILLVDGGDPIENCFNVSSQLVTNDLPVPEQIRVFRRLMLEAIKTLAPLVPTFTYVAVPSNHGAARIGYKSAGGTVDADHGLEISYQLEDAIEGHPDLENVFFIRPESLDETAVVRVSGTKLAFHHGHQSSGPNGHGKWWSGQDHGRMAGGDADILVTAHYHSLRVEQSGNGRWIIGVSSSDASSDWFTNRTGESAQQGMTAFDVKDGMWSNLRIL
jgi:hypothetical protein